MIAAISVCVVIGCLSWMVVYGGTKNKSEIE